LRMPRQDVSNDAPWVVLPSYNGARKLPLLTPLLAHLLHARGLNVLIHGMPHDPARVTSAQVMQAMEGHENATHLIALNVHQMPAMCQKNVKNLSYQATERLHHRLAWLLDVRRVVGVRNSAHSIVKLINPLAQSGVAPERVLVVSSYTHPEFFACMGAALMQLPQRAMLLRGTEGEPVADARRTPRMELLAHGVRSDWCAQQEGPLATLPELPGQIDAATTAAYIRRVLAGELPCPAPIAKQVDGIVHALAAA
jgi:anthranilate phosphoribosyltransferase